MSIPRIALTAPVGPEEAPLLVLGPSLGTSAILWENAMPALVERYRVIAWDLPGHGASPAATDSFTVADLADAVAAAVRALGADRVLYAGVSLGGATGLELGLRHPDLVSALAIVASGAQLGEPAAWHERAATVRAQSTSALIIPSAQRWFAPGSIEREPELSGRLLHALRDADAESYSLCCEALAAYDVRDRLGELRMPVVALWGEHDAVAPEPKAVEIADGVVHGRAEMIAGVAHLPPAEDPAATAAALLAFFESADDASSTPVTEPAPRPDGEGLTDGERYAQGMRARREVLSDAHVDRAIAGTTSVTADFQDLITRYAWGDIWSRPGLDRRSRSVAVLTSLIAHGHHEELAMHVRAALRNGLTIDEIREVILQSAIYSGVPAANSAFRIANEVLGEES